MHDCIFCKIIEDGSESDVTVYEDDDLIGLISLHQKSANWGHVLLLPKAHHANLYEVPATLHAPLMLALQTLARAAKKAFSAEGVQIRQNNEAAAGQDVFHLHFHIIPRFSDDAFDQQPYERLSFDIRRELALRLRAAIAIQVKPQNFNAQSIAPDYPE